MSILDQITDERIEGVEVTNEFISLTLHDKRKISAPLLWFPKLLDANEKQRSTWEICNAGFGIHWPYVDEDISVSGLLKGIPSPHAHPALRS